MNIRLSSNVDEHSCTTCANRRPWDQTIASLEHQLRAHGVTWHDFVVMHGRDLSCAEALDSPGQKNAGLYVVATDAQGNEARSAKIFARKDGYYVGVKAALNGTAFQATSADENESNEGQSSSEGTLLWSNGDRATVRDAIVAPERIAFDATSAGGTYSVVLRPYPGSDQWVGRWTSGGRGGIVNARVNTSGDDVDLRGRWLDGDDYAWELTLSLPR
ncbi:hypothetical protein [Sorangium sp. So ce542]|uniref:hypothetical protein n=1 Tax=Sorangium sp. So ce542 TaxID=3133316 RepID=UPI003F611596